MRDFGIQWYLVYAFGFFIQFAPAAFLAYSVFEEKEFRRRPLYVEGFVLSFIGICSLLFPVYYSFFYGTSNSANWANGYSLVVQLFCFFIFFRTLGSELYKKVFAIVFAMIYGTLVFTTVSSLEVILKCYPRQEIYIPVDMLFFLGTTIFYFPFMYSFMKHVLSGADHLIGKYLKKNALTLTVVLVLAYIMIFMTLTSIKLDNFKMLFLFIAINVCILFIFNLVFEMSGILENTAQKEKEAELYKQQVLMRSEQFRQLYENMEQTRHLKHDMRHHMIVMEGYIEREEYEKVKEYIAKFSEDILQESPRSFCDNSTIDIILGHYYEMAGKNQIQFQIKIDVPHQIEIDNVDLCTVLGNLLDNAIYSCIHAENAEDTKPFININISVINHNLLIVQENTCDGNVELSKDKSSYLTTKPEGSGIGLNSIKMVAERYDGSAQFQYRNGIFYSYIKMCMPRGENHN